MSRKKRESFSKEIDRVVVLSFGIAFFLIYTASAILLFITEDDTSRYYGKAVVMFVIYLALYVAASFLVTQRIARLFGPLDRVAHSLMRDEKLTDNGDYGIKRIADSLKAQSDQVDALSRELETTQSDLDDAFLVRRQDQYQQGEMMKQILQDLSALQKRQEEAVRTSDKLSMLLKNSMPLENEIRIQRENLYGQMQQIEDRLRENGRLHEDTAGDLSELGGSFGLLENIHTDAEELLNTIYNEMTALQSLASQVNLYAMNTALDISRAGSITVSAISALDEIKELTAKINTKTDDVLLSLIRTRNALKLAMDQTGECREKGAECGRTFDMSRSVQEEQQEGIRQMLAAGDVLTDEVSKLAGAVYEAGLLTDRRREDQLKVKADLERMCTALSQWRQENHAEE